MTLSGLLGAQPAVFFGLTVVLFGATAWMVGRAVAGTWRPVWQVVAYVALLGTADRFLHFALFDGVLLSLYGYLVHTAVLQVIGLLGYQATRARRMVQQYPWLYEPAGPLGWRRRTDNAGCGAAGGD